MRNFVYILLVLGVYLPSNACSLKAYDYCETAVGKKCEFYQQDNFGEDSRDELPLYRKKSKSRSIQEFVPLVQSPNYSFFPHTSYIYFTYTSNPRVQLFHCAQRLRGPPLV